VTQDTDMMAAPVLADNGTKTLPRRVPKGLMPSTWIGRGIRVEHTACGALRETVGVLGRPLPGWSYPQRGRHPHAYQLGHARHCRAAAELMPRSSVELQPN
jgi:hypothetical protein